MAIDGKPDDWPFEALKLGEYSSFTRRAARVVQERQLEFSDALKLFWRAVSSFNLNASAPAEGTLYRLSGA